MPDFVGHDLVFRTLLHEADLFRLFALVDLVKISAVKEDFSRPSAVRGKDGF